ncbi:RecX family transcriptional regulator [Flavobacteriales bacterium]|nr:RecX family transcriptional regulator [Flavobacteriales bacterium]
MHNKRVYDINIAIERIKNYCALQDRCQWDVIQKLRQWGLQQATKDHILEILITNKFIDEERFSTSFCRGKFRIKNWGKHKIVNELRRKQISSICINRGLKEIDEKEYDLVLEKLFYQKERSIKDKNQFIRKTKIANFLIQRGFENNLVWDKIRELSDK